MGVNCVGRILRWNAATVVVVFGLGYSHGFGFFGASLKNLLGFFPVFCLKRNFG